MKVAWEKSDELLLCDRLKIPLKFEELPEPDWENVLSKKGGGPYYDNERAHFNIHVESIGFDKGKEFVVYRVQVAGAKDLHLKFRSKKTGQRKFF